MERRRSTMSDMKEEVGGLKMISNFLSKSLASVFLSNGMHGDERRFQIFNESKRLFRSLTNGFKRGKYERRRLTKTITHGGKTFRILVLGAKGVGKSSIINRCVYNRFSEDHIVTKSTEVHESRVIIENENELKVVNLEFNEFCGEMKCDDNGQFLSEVREADAIMIVYSCTESHEIVIRTMADVIKTSTECIPIVIVQNKLDLEVNIESSCEYYFGLTNTSFAPMSAKQNFNINETMRNLAHQLVS